MKLQLSGGPLDGVVVLGLRIAPVPDLVEFSHRRKVFSYVRCKGGTLHHAPPAEVPSEFESWWEVHGAGDDEIRELARRAWDSGFEAKH